MIDAKHISKKGNIYSKHDIYFGTIVPYSSFRDYAYGYVEKGNLGFITFIGYIKNPFSDKIKDYL